MSDTKKNDKPKLERSWKELERENRKYLERKQEEQEAKEQMLNWQKYIKRNND